MAMIDRDNEAGILKKIRGLVVDLDGVLHVGPEPVESLPAFLSFLGRRAMPVVYVTNNSTLTPESLYGRLSGFGIQADSSHIITSATATARYLSSEFPHGSRVLVIGEEGLCQAVKDMGFKIGNDAPQAVAVGLDRQINYQKISQAASAVLAGASFIACNIDSGAPIVGGIAPGAGAMVAAIQAVVQVAPVVIGKPEATMFFEAAKRMRLKPDECAVIGDRLDIDIVCAERAGMTGILVLSGMTKLDMLQDSPHIPDLVYADIGEMVSHWEKMF